MALLATTREFTKSAVRLLATAIVLPELLSFRVRALLFGRDRALESSTQMLGLIPGLVGQYLRRAFLAHVIGACHPRATICFGVIFSKTGARVGANAYIGPRCHIGLADIERDVLLAAGVHITSGMHTHGSGDPSVPIRDQEGQTTRVRIGAGSWVGSAAVVMADIGRDTIVGAGAVVTKPLPDRVLAAGVPARVIRSRQETALQLSK
ncbi:MAG TPA: acyltransferase [Gemmataceae bacterium]|nr:acyltransferase [Gemmataceae bacterium]